MSKYLKHGSNWKVYADADANYVGVLPPGNYTVARDNFGAYYLEESAPFEIGRIYGDTRKTAERILRTYIDRGRSTGVLAVGEKGTGKTLLTKLVASMAAQDHDMPTILVNKDFGDDGFNNFLATIDGRAVVLFDEFEKVYDDGQEALLTLLDGVHQANKLFLLTANNAWKVDRNLISRPGRIFYYLEFGALTTEFIEEYCGENLANTSQIPMILDLASVYGNFSFDSLKALVEELNRYGESPAEAMRFLNIRMDGVGRDRRYEFAVCQDGEPIGIDRLGDRSAFLDPVEDSFRLDVAGNGDEKSARITLRPSMIVAIRDGGDQVVYHDQGFEIVATVVKSFTFDPLASLASGYDRNGVANHA